MSKFEKLFNQTDSELIKQRVNILKAKAVRENNKYIENIKDQIENIKMEILGLEDMGREESTDLTIKNFDVSKWVLSIQEKYYQLALLEKKLEVAEKVEEKYF